MTLSLALVFLFEEGTLETFSPTATFVFTISSVPELIYMYQLNSNSRDQNVAMSLTVKKLEKHFNLPN